MPKEVTVDLGAILCDAIDKGIVKYNADMEKREWNPLDTFQAEAIKHAIFQELIRVIK